jgi:hypothetical protein
VLFESIRERFTTGLLLGELRKLEASSSVTLDNALHLFAELGAVLVAPGSGRDMLISRGPRFSDLREIADRIRSGILS